MTLKEFKTYVEGLPQGKVFEYGISNPFSWRGSYDEVAFDVVQDTMVREDILKHIELAYSEEFYGYKGGKYRYHDFTDIHFEQSVGSWSDGGYCASWIAKLEDSEVYHSQEERLVKLMLK